jgi:hypothetical protein
VGSPALHADGPGSRGWGVAACVHRSDQYRRFAQECLEMARTSESEQTRVVLIQMAQVWFRLAEARESEDARTPRETETKKPSD